MTEILLIRHGQSANNAGPDEERVCDPDLTSLGKRQAQIAADFLSQRTLTHLYCSPFLRSLETTLPIASATGLTPKVRPDIFEVGGCYSGHLAVGREGEPGMGAQQIKQAYPGWEVDNAISEAGWWGRPYETDEQADARAASVSRWLADEVVPTGGVHALVIHADFKYLLLSEMLGEEPKLEEPLFNLGITTFSLRDGGWAASELNSVAHFDSELVSH